MGLYQLLLVVPDFSRRFWGNFLSFELKDPFALIPGFSYFWCGLFLLVNCENLEA